MPLQKGKSKAAMAANYKVLKAEGKPKKQRIAIMLSEAGLSKKNQHPSSGRDTRFAKHGKK